MSEALISFRARPRLALLTITGMAALLLSPTPDARAEPQSAQALAPVTALSGRSLAATPVDVVVTAAGSGKVGPDFAGFSYEKDRIGAGL
ncbi:hypothetical protein, partial [Streptacidiphilus carbonis]|uniref:hypothetical protein n=1 Tax=Streptacidiphilus carbonis TaxID=105422 RepID=UPI0005AABCBD